MHRRQVQLADVFRHQVVDDGKLVRGNQPVFIDVLHIGIRLVHATQADDTMVTMKIVIRMTSKNRRFPTFSLLSIRHSPERGRSFL